MLLAVDTVTIAWVVQHLPSHYDEVLGGSTNTFTANYQPQSSCAIRVTVVPSWSFNNARGDDHSRAYSVKGDTRIGKRLDAPDDGDTAVLDFTKIDPSSLRVSNVDAFLGTEHVHTTGFEFTYSNENDAKQMLSAMQAMTQECSASMPAAASPSPSASPYAYEE